MPSIWRSVIVPHKSLGILAIIYTCDRMPSCLVRATIPGPTRRQLQHPRCYPTPTVAFAPLPYFNLLLGRRMTRTSSFAYRRRNFSGSPPLSSLIRGRLGKWRELRGARWQNRKITFEITHRRNDTGSQSHQTAIWVWLLLNVDLLLSSQTLCRIRAGHDKFLWRDRVSLKSLVSYFGSHLNAPI